jgi:DNA-binding GntR family transcriptional regulator
MIVAQNRYRPIRATVARAGGTRMGQEQIVRAMGVSILRGDYPEGALLPAEGDLMAQFGISRTVLREVLKTLAAKGLVVSKTRVGTKVRHQGAGASISAWICGSSTAFMKSGSRSNRRRARWLPCAAARRALPICGR